MGCRRAALRLGYGIFNKVAIANLLFPTYDSIFSGANVHTPGNVIVLGIVVYSVYMYADFSGGIDIVEGISELFGVQMAQNFRQPYFSVSLSDFWRRWYMSLGAWMRDYVFYPFALLTPLQSFGKRATKRMGRHAGRTLPACIANIVVFLCVGLWHGAEWHYVLWDLYNGMIVALADLLAPAFAGLARMLHVNRESKGFHVSAVVRTFLVVQVGRYFDCITNNGALGICPHNTVFNFNSVSLATTLAARGIQRAYTLGFPRSRSWPASSCSLPASCTRRTMTFARSSLPRGCPSGPWPMPSASCWWYWRFPTRSRTGACLIASELRVGTAVVILDQNGTGRKPHVQHRTTRDRNRDLHQIRS